MKYQPLIRPILILIGLAVFAALFVNVAGMSAQAFNDWSNDREMGFIEGQQEELHMQAEDARNTIQRNSNLWLDLEAKKASFM